MHLRESRKRPASWAEYKRSIGHRWSTPWYGVELAFEWIAYFLGRWAFLEVLEYSGTFSVLIAVVFYCADTGNRRKQKHYQAWQVINTAQGKGGNGGRIEALEELNEDHVSLVGVDVSGAFLQGLHLEKGDLARATLNAADLRNAIVVSSDFRDADLRFANFRECDCVRTSFRGAMLDEADFWGANLSGVDLTEASLVNTDLRNTNLLGIKWKGIKTLKMADIAGARNAPDGFVAWALRNGAIRSSSDSE